ncbi:MAG: hypothetical protein DRP51_07720 [Candidatus Zixiibacteriota bacterium]|nr:MAG: hypothetical protein DRP51_07720 [candidate division Zixibacteria bacterium]
MYLSSCYNISCFNKIIVNFPYILIVNSPKSNKKQTDFEEMHFLILTFQKIKKGWLLFTRFLEKPILHYPK